MERTPTEVLCIPEARRNEGISKAGSPRNHSLRSEGPDMSGKVENVGFATLAQSLECRELAA